MFLSPKLVTLYCTRNCQLKFEIKLRAVNVSINLILLDSLTGTRIINIMFKIRLNEYAFIHSRFEKNRKIQFLKKAYKMAIKLQKRHCVAYNQAVINGNFLKSIFKLQFKKYREYYFNIHFLSLFSFSKLRKKSCNFP